MFCFEVTVSGWDVGVSVVYCLIVDVTGVVIGIFVVWFDWNVELNGFIVVTYGSFVVIGLVVVVMFIVVGVWKGDVIPSWLIDPYFRNKSNESSNKEPVDVLDDIGNMLANLTDELDAMLEEEKRQGLNSDD